MLNEAKLHGHLHFEELDISVEVPAGSYRRGVNKKTGEEWKQKVSASYGYIKNTHSPDGEHLDCYVRRNPKKGAKVYVMHQMTVDGTKFDEDKVMLGYSSKEEAIKAFKDMTFKPTTMFGGVSVFDMEHFRLAAYQAKNSKVILTSEENYGRFKKKGVLPHGIKSSLSVARKVSESLSEGLAAIGADLAGAEEEQVYEDVVEVSEESWDQELGTVIQYEHEATLKDAEAFAQNHGFECQIYTGNDVENLKPALVFIDEDEFERFIDFAEQNGPLEYLGDQIGLIAHKYQTSVGETMNENEKYAVVVHTQIMENIGTSTSPAWATAGTKTILVKENLQTYLIARAVASEVSSGNFNVEIPEGSYIIGVDILSEGDFRQFYEAEEEVDEAEVVEEDTTDDVFFAQQVQEAKRLAGVTAGTYENKGTPTVQETRAKLEALTQQFLEGLAEENEEESEELEEAVEEVSEIRKLTAGQLASALRAVREHVISNPKQGLYDALKEVSEKLFGDVRYHNQLIAAAELEYGSLEHFNQVIRGRVKTIPKARTITRQG
jgi:hypothetical protein